LTIGGYVVAALELAGALFFPVLLAPFWVLIAAIVLLRHPTDAAVQTAPTR
jgi:hypothetical protein